MTVAAITTKMTVLAWGVQNSSDPDRRAELATHLAELVLNAEAAPDATAQDADASTRGIGHLHLVA